MAYDEMTAQLLRENEKLRAACADIMSVRDQFAKAAMQGMWASDRPGYECSGKDDALLGRAKTAYRMADAMMVVRGTPGVDLGDKGQQEGWA